MKVTVMKRKIIAMFLIFFFPASLMAGTVYELKCQNEKCNFKGTFEIGGGFSYSQVTGYCWHCKKFVCITEKDDWQSSSTPSISALGDENHKILKDNAKMRQAFIGTVWSPSTGRMVGIYKCPLCSNLFASISEISDIKKCPKCISSKVLIRRVMLMD